MSSVKEKMTALADAIRDKTYTFDLLTIDDMTEAVKSLSVGGGGTVVPSTQSLTVTPTKEKQTFSSSDLGSNTYYSVVTVNAIPSEYITTSDATALSGDILNMKTAYVNGKKVTGNMTNYGDVEEQFPNTRDTLSINANGYFKTITVNLTRKTLEVTPTKSAQTLRASSEGSDVFYTQVNVAPIPAEYINTADATATEGTILEGKTAYVNGEKVTGKYISPSPEDVRYGVTFGFADLFPDYSGGEINVYGSFTGDATATASDIAAGKTAYVLGAKVTGTASGTSDATVTASDLLEGVTAYGKDGKVTGTMPFSTFEFNSGRFTVSRGYTAEDSVYDVPLMEHQIVRDNVVLITAGYNNEDVEVTVGNAIEGGFFIPGPSDIVIPAQSYLLNNYVIMGDEDLRPENIKSGVTIFDLTGTFTSDADAAASDIAEGKTAYVKGEKVTGTASGSGSVSPLWTCEYRNFMTGYPPCNTTQTPTRTQQGWHAFDGKLYNGNSYINKSMGPDINWTYACTRHYPNHDTCLAIGDGKLYFVGTDVVCLTPDLTGVTQVMEGDNGRYFFLCGEDIYLSLSEANTYKKVEGIKVSKILNQRMFSYEPCVMVITIAGDLAEVSCEYDSDVGNFSVKSVADGDPFINYFYVSPEEMVSGGMGYLGGYEFAIRSSGLWYRRISESNSQWIKPENAPDLIPTNWLGYCSAAAEEKEEYNSETDEYRLYYELKEETLALHIDKDGALWAMRANATLSGDDSDPDFQLNGVTFERIGEDNDWQCVPPIPPYSGSTSAKTGYAQKGGKLVLMWTKLVDGKLVVCRDDEIISPSGRLLGCYENCCFFAPAGATVDMSRAGGTY